MIQSTTDNSKCPICSAKFGIINTDKVNGKLNYYAWCSKCQLAFPIITGVQVQASHGKVVNK